MWTYPRRFYIKFEVYQKYLGSEHLGNVMSFLSKRSCHYSNLHPLFPVLKQRLPLLFSYFFEIFAYFIQLFLSRPSAKSFSHRFPFQRRFNRLLFVSAHYMAKPLNSLTTHTAADVCLSLQFSIKPSSYVFYCHRQNQILLSIFYPQSFLIAFLCC